jgi:DNA-binding NarL/FixJ family response regulator
MANLSGPKRLRIVLADDHADMLDAVRSVLDRDFEVVRAVRCGRELLLATASLKPDVVVTDMAMPDLDGIEAGRQIVARQLADAVIVLTMHNDPQLVERAVEAGIRGFVLKVDAGEELVEAVHQVSTGTTYFSRMVRTT